MLIGTLYLLKTAWDAALGSKTLGVGIRTLQMVAQSELGLAGATQVLTTSFWQSAAAWAATPMGMATLAVGGVIAILGAIDLFNITLEENQEKLQDLKSEYDTLSNSVIQTEANLSNIKKAIDDINESDEITLTTQNQLDLLTLEEARLESLLELERIRRDEAKEELETQAIKTVYDEVENPYADIVHADNYGTVHYEQTSRIEVVTGATSEMEEQLAIINELNAVEEKNGKLTEEQIAIKNRAIATYDKASASVSDYAYDLAKEVEGLDETSEVYVEVMDAIKGYTDATREGSDSVQDQVDELANLEEQMALIETETVALVQKQEEVNEAYDEAKSSVSSLGSEFSNLSSIMSDYNSNNGWTLDNLLALLDTSSEYINLLSIENGQMVLNEEAAIAMANAKIDTAMATAVEAAQAELAIIANSELENQYNNTGASALGLASNVANAGISAYNSGLNAIEGAKGWDTFYSSMLNDSGIETDWGKEQADLVMNNLQDTLYTYEALRGQLGDYTSDLNINSSALGSNSDALKEQKTLLEAERDAYLDNIDAQIEALNKKRDAEEEYWDDRIAQLEEENDKIEDNIELQKLQENLARAKSSQSMIFQDGEFTYGADDEAITEATGDLADFEREQKLQDDIAELEKLKEQALDNIDAQIEALEEQRVQIEEQYAIRIEMLEEQYSQEQALGQTNSDYKKNKYDTDLSNQKAYEEASLKSHYDYINAMNSMNLAPSIVQSGGGGSASSPSYSMYATGVASVKDDEVAVTGDNPNHQELVVGKKVNRNVGQFTALSKGSGVVNAKSTQTLAGILNSITSNSKVSSVQENVSNKSNTTMINIDRIELQGVNSPDTFANALVNKFKNYTIQHS